MDLQMFGNKGSSAGSTGSNVEKASGAGNSFGESMSPSEAARYDQYWEVKHLK